MATETRRTPALGIASDLRAGETLRAYRNRVDPPRTGVRYRIARAFGASR